MNGTHMAADKRANIVPQRDPTVKIVQRMHTMIRDLRGDGAKEEADAPSPRRTQHRTEDEERLTELCEFA